MLYFISCLCHDVFTKNRTVVETPGVAGTGKKCAKESLQSFPGSRSVKTGEWWLLGLGNSSDLCGLNVYSEVGYFALVYSFC